MIEFIKNYRVIIVAVLSILGTLATLTATDVDDKLVASANSFVNEVAPDGSILVPIKPVN